jgi:hypothetical protein
MILLQLQHSLVYAIRRPRPGAVTLYPLAAIAAGEAKEANQKRQMRAGRRDMPAVSEPTRSTGSHNPQETEPAAEQPRPTDRSTQLHSHTLRPAGSCPET